MCGAIEHKRKWNVITIFVPLFWHNGGGNKKCMAAGPEGPKSGNNPRKMFGTLSHTAPKPRGEETYERSGGKQEKNTKNCVFLKKNIHKHRLAQRWSI